MFDAECRQGMLEAVGVTATIQGGETFFVKPPLFFSQQIAMSGMDINNENPFCIADSDDIAALGITEGQSGTVITIQGKDWRVLSIDPESTGFVAIELGAV